MYNKIIITCEHATNFIPDSYIQYFDKLVLETHRAFDIGADLICSNICEKYSIPYYKADVSRLLIDCNRSLNSKSLISSYLSSFSKIEKKFIIENYYKPYRNIVTNVINDIVSKQKSVLHLSIHSFTPILNGIKRTADIGILYDTGRFIEKELAILLKTKIKKHNSNLKVKSNYPYKGISDSFSTFLKKKLDPNLYYGIELEINQNIIFEKELLNTIFLMMDVLQNGIVNA